MFCRINKIDLYGLFDLGITFERIMLGLSYFPHVFFVTRPVFLYQSHFVVIKVLLGASVLHKHILLILWLYKHISKQLQIPITELQSYESLLNHLCGSLKSDLDRVYAIFCWIVNQRLPVINDVKHIPNTESPESFLYRIVQRKGTFAELMCKMCRYCKWLVFFKIWTFHLHLVSTFHVKQKWRKNVEFWNILFLL